MGVRREKIERLELHWNDGKEPWKDLSYSRKWRKRQMNKYIRRRSKHVADDDVSMKRGRKPYKGWEY